MLISSGMYHEKETMASPSSSSFEEALKARVLRSIFLLKTDALKGDHAIYCSLTIHFLKRNVNRVASFSSLILASKSTSIAGKKV